MSRFVMPLQSAFGQRVVPFDGAKLFFFDTGTSTPKNTFSDEALGTPNANPVVADADGRFPAIFLEDGAYKVQIKDKNDVQEWTQDPYRRSLTALNGIELSAGILEHDTIALMKADTTLVVGQVVAVLDYATGTNSGIMFGAVVAAATGTDDGGSFIDLNNGLQWKQNFVKDVVSIKQFGAVGNETTDESTAIQAAIDFVTKTVNSIGSEVTGGTVFTPPGAYTCQTSIVISNNAGVSLIGSGKTKSSWIFGASATTALIDFDTGNNNYRGEIRGMRLTGGIGGHTDALIKISGNGNQIDIVDNWIDSCDQGIVGNPTSDSLITDNTFEFVKEMINLTNAVDMVITRNMFFGRGPTGAGTQPSPFLFTGCSRSFFNQNKIIFDAALADSTATIEVENCTEFDLSNNVFFNRAITTPSSCFTISNSENIDISHNKLPRTAKHTIDIDTCKQITAIGIHAIGTESGSFNVCKVLDSIDVEIGIKTRIPDAGDSLVANTLDIVIDNSKNVQIDGCNLRKDLLIQANSPRYTVSKNNIFKTAPQIPGMGTVTGTWRVGDSTPIVPAVAGTFAENICTRSGRVGSALAGVTGSITISTDQLTVNILDKLEVGDFILITGVTGAKEILAIAGLVLTLDSNADATVSGAAVAYQNALVKTANPISA